MPTGVIVGIVVGTRGNDEPAAEGNATNGATSGEVKLPKGVKLTQHYEDDALVVGIVNKSGGGEDGEEGDPVEELGAGDLHHELLRICRSTAKRAWEARRTSAPMMSRRSPARHNNQPHNNAWAATRKMTV